MTNMERTGNMPTSSRPRNSVTNNKAVEVSGVELIGRRKAGSPEWVGMASFRTSSSRYSVPVGVEDVLPHSEDRIIMLNCICHSMMPHGHTNRCCL